MKKIGFACMILIFCISMFGCTNTQTVGLAPDAEDMIAKSTNQQDVSIEYTNTQYGFEFTLPASWKGYTIITDEWEGLPIGGETPVKTGPMISIRHPKWTAENPRQDIPIMIFTISQWNALQKGDFHIGAAPIGPAELGRNSEYVFALPARYNFAFPTGYEEVEKILKGKPLKPIEIVDTINQ